MPGAAGCSPANIPFLEKLTEAPDSATSLRSPEYDAHYSDGAVCHAVIDLFDSICGERPLLCHIDDAHNLDKSSLGLLQLIQTRLSARSLLLILSADRKERFSELKSSIIRLRPLDTSALSALAREFNVRTGLRLSDDALARCMSLSGGSPGHLELLVGHANRAREIENVPADLVCLIDDRIAGLTTASLHTLQACVIFGPDCSADALSALTGLSRYCLLAALQELEDRSLITTTRKGIFPRSALVEERAQASVGGSIQSVLHRRAARFLEKEHRGSTPSQSIAWRIAGHWDEAGDTVSALRWRRICWRQLISIGKPSVATDSIRAQLQSAASPSERATLLDALIDALQSTADLDALSAVLRERIALSEHVHDSRARRSALAFDAAEASINNYDESAPYLSQLRTHLHSKVLDVGRRVRASRLLLIAADDAVDAVAANDVFAVNEQLHPHDECTHLEHLHARLVYHTVFGSRTEAIRCADILADIAREGECSWPILMSELNISMARHTTSALPSSYSHLEQRFESCRTAGMDTVALRFSARLTVLLFDNGRLADATKWGAIAHTLAREVPTKRLSGDYLTSQIDLALISEDFDRASALVSMLVARAPLQGSSRLSRASLASCMRLKQFRQHDIQDEHLSALIAWHERARAYGRHDDIMEVIWVALNARGEHERASQLLREYLLCSRREVRPPNFQLQMRTAADPVWITFRGAGPTSTHANAPTNVHLWQVRADLPTPND
jgi:hypothetical protein